MTMNHTLTYLVCRARAFTAALAAASVLVAIAAGAATCPAGLAAVNPTPTSDFLINGNGTVTHTATGLMWNQCNEGLTGNACATGSATYLLWPDALSAAKNSAFAGYADWRLPNKQELESLTDTRCYSPSINDTVFPGTVAGWTWTSTTFAADPAYAWPVDFAYGYSFAGHKISGGNYVRLVRGG